MNPLLLNIPDAFTTARLALRTYRPGDGSAYFHALRRDRDHLYEFLPPELMTWQTETDAEIRIRELMAEWQMRRLFIFGIWEPESGAHVGETYLANADWQASCIELGYFLFQAYTGRGYATEAARGTLRFAFEHLQVSRVELQCAADNTASMGVAARCDFRLEGVMRQRQHKKDGAVVDRLWYGLLLPEWKATAASTEPTTARNGKGS